MRTGSIIRRAALAVAIALSPFAFANPSSAHEAGNYSCEATYLCAWEHSHYSGARGRWSGTNSHWSAFPKSTGGNWNDVASSARNAGTSSAARLWEHSSFGGRGLCFPLGTRAAHLSDYNFNDITSSNDWRSSC